jgi:hypothetical protein
MLRTGQRKDIYNLAAGRRNQNEKIALDNDALPFLHPSYEAVFFMPLSLLPYRAAYFVWAGVNFAILDRAAAEHNTHGYGSVRSAAAAAGEFRHSL